MNYFETLKSRFVNDVGSAVDFYISHNINSSSGDKIGFFGSLLLIFPTVEALAGLSYGRVGKAEQTVKFLKKEFSKINPKYATVGVYVYYAFRHGLTHNFLPKKINVDGKNYEWSISLSQRDPGNVDTLHLAIHGNYISVDARQFYDDVISVIKIFEKRYTVGDKYLVHSAEKYILEINKYDNPNKRSYMVGIPLLPPEWPKE